MKSLTKAGILIVALVIPVFIYLSLKTLGTNHYKLPRFIPQIDSTNDQPIIKNGDTLFRSIPAFSLIDQNGQVFDQSKTKGKVYVADFIFTRCNTICPKMSSQLTRYQDAFSNNPAVLIVSHTVDADFDTVPVLKKYAKEYDAIDGKWFFLTGDKKEIYKMAHRSYFIPLLENEGEQDPNNTFTHSERMMLVDWNGVIRGFYDGSSKKDIDRMILETKILLDIKKEQTKI
jgi:protein SCO1/2